MKALLSGPRSKRMPHSSALSPGVVEPWIRCLVLICFRKNTCSISPPDRHGIMYLHLSHVNDHSLIQKSCHTIILLTIIWQLLFATRTEQVMLALALLRSLYYRSIWWINSPLRSFGSNQVDFGGMRRSASATANSSWMEVGYMANATSMSLSALRFSSSRPRIPPIKSIRLSVLGSPIPRTGVSSSRWRNDTSSA